jgi:hypothetical protein
MPQQEAAVGASGYRIASVGFAEESGGLCSWFEMQL